VPPAPDDGLLPALVAPEPVVRRVVADLAEDVRREAAGFDAARFVVARFVVARFVVDVPRDDVDREDDALLRLDAGFAADEPREADALRDAAGFDAVRRRAAGFFAAERLAAGRLAVVVADAAVPVPRLTSSAETRLASPSTSRRSPLSSSRTRSSSTSRIRLAATATSPAISCAGPRSDWALPAVAANVRSTADRTASTASTAPPAGLSFLPLFLSFLSFFAMAARS
jgi:hypothetical protein